MRPCSTVQKHGLQAIDWHVERADDSLPVLEGDVPAVYGGRIRRLQRLAGRGLGALRHSMVPVAELELDHVADGGRDEVRDEGVLRTADDHGDQAEGALVLRCPYCGGGQLLSQKE